MSCLFEGLADLAGGVGGVTEGVHRLDFFGEQVRADGGLVVLGAAAGPQGNGGVQPGLGLDGQVALVSVLLVGAGLVGVPGLGVDGGDHPVLRGAPGNAPAPVAAVGVLGSTRAPH